MNELTKLERVAATVLAKLLPEGGYRQDHPGSGGLIADIAWTAVEAARLMLAECGKHEPKPNETYGGWKPCPSCGKPMVQDDTPWSFLTKKDESDEEGWIPRTPEELAATRRELDAVAPTPGEKLTMMMMGDGWIPHTPGSPMPCAGDLRVDVRFFDGEVSRDTEADYWMSDGGDDRHPHGNWGVCDDPSDSIIAWKPAK